MPICAVDMCQFYAIDIFVAKVVFFEYEGGFLGRDEFRTPLRHTYAVGLYAACVVFTSRGFGGG